MNDDPQAVDDTDSPFWIHTLALAATHREVKTTHQAAASFLEALGEQQRQLALTVKAIRDLPDISLMDTVPDDKTVLPSKD